MYSSIDLWKGCIAVVSERFERSLVTKEFPIYNVTDKRVGPEFLSVLLKSRYYQRAFRAITTGHSNRRRTQQGDFEALEIAFPPDLSVQLELTKPVIEAMQQRALTVEQLEKSRLEFDQIIDWKESDIQEEDLIDSDEGDLEE